MIKTAMRTDVLQAAALCCYGNAFFSERDPEKAPELHGTNSTFRSIHEIVFSRRNLKVPVPEPEQGSTAAWLKKLKSEGVERLVLTLDQCSLDSTKQADDKWGIVTDGGRGCEIWQPTWKRRSMNDSSDATPWRVIYTGERFNLWSLTASMPLEEAGAKLSSATKMARDFLMLNRATNLAGPLDRCLSLQSEGNQDMMGFPDLCPSTFSGDAKVLIASALRIILIMNSAMWTSDAVATEEKAQFSVNALRLWHGACVALETAAVTGQIAVGSPTRLGSSRLEAS